MVHVIAAGSRESTRFLQKSHPGDEVHSIAAGIDRVYDSLETIGRLEADIIVYPEVSCHFLYCFVVFV